MSLKQWTASAGMPTELPPRPFKIGLRPIAAGGNWLTPLTGMGHYLSEKAALFSQSRNEVFGDTGGTDDEQRQVYQLISSHLLGRFPHIYKRLDDDDLISVDSQQFLVSRGNEPWLLSASKLVAADLCIMSKRDGQWVLSAGSVCFPSVWRLSEKLGKPMAGVHAPVPGFAQGTRNAVMIERIFDRLPIGQIFERGNWSIHSVDDLHLPHHPNLDGVDAKSMFLRCEQQTLTKLQSGKDILFTIGVRVEPIDALNSRPHYAETLAKQLMDLDGSEVEYKGLSNARDGLQRHLLSLAGND